MKCETCVFGVWDEGDESVGMMAFIDECKNKSKLARERFEETEYGGINECSFYIEQLVPEWQLIRCPECNSQISEFVKHIRDEFRGLFKCSRCDNEFEAEMPMY